MLAPRKYEEHISPFVIKSRSSLYLNILSQTRLFFKVIDIFRFDQRNCHRQNFEGNDIVLL